MKRFATMVLAGIVLVVAAQTAVGAVGWCGNIWPVNGTSYTSNDNIGVYVQVWKPGVTDQPGQGADIAAYLYYRCGGTSDPFTEVGMVYNVDIGNNDEYMGTIPAGHGCSQIEFYVKVVDLTDMAECYGNDQWGNPPNFFLPITQVLGQDVMVTFHLCLAGETTTSGDVCVTGSGNELTNWGGGVVMTRPCPTASPKLYQVTINFLAGSNPHRWYKYKKDGCQTWESTGDHSFVIDDSGPTMDLWTDGWEYQTPDCPECPSPIESGTWGTIKALYR
ncbi:MAG: hypothetical protein FJY74_06450 [Candidatus Eisenbacteria bacterium]|nr:hypothetical protein [Candidatus Eisenbacteria bacterium]